MKRFSMKEISHGWKIKPWIKLTYWHTFIIQQQVYSVTISKAHNHTVTKKQYLCSKVPLRYLIPARVWYWPADNFNDHRLRQEALKPGWSVMHFGCFPSSLTTSSSCISIMQSAISWQHLHSFAFMSKSTRQFPQLHL